MVTQYKPSIWWGSALEAIGVSGMIISASVHQENSSYAPYNFILSAVIYALGRTTSNRTLEKEIRENRKELSDKL